MRLKRDQQKARDELSSLGKKGGSKKKETRKGKREDSGVR